MANPPMVPRDDKGGSGGPDEKQGLVGNTVAQRIERRAVKERWPLTEEQREGIIEKQVETALDSKASRRERTSAARVLVQADRVNVDEAKQLRDYTLKELLTNSRILSVQPPAEAEEPHNGEGTPVDKFTYEEMLVYVRKYRGIE